MKERLKKELKIAVIIFIFLTLTYVVLYFVDIIKQPSITGMIVYDIETEYKNYTFTNTSLYIFNDSLINLSNGIRLKATHTFDNITNTTDISYPSSAIIDTLDFIPENLNSWDKLTKNELLNDQNINYYYSIDSQNYTLIDFNLSNDFNLSSVNSSKIMFRINLISNTTETAVVNYLTLKYLVSIACVEDWQCEEWSECYENNTKARICVDNNACGSEDDKPEIITTCTYIPVCTPDWTALYGDCLTNDTKLKYYNDTDKCDNISTIPSDNNTYVLCDYCLPNWTCSEYGDCIDEEQECLSVNDENNCYNITNLSSDDYTDDYSEFIIECNETSNETESSETSSESEGGEESAPAGGEATVAKLEAKVYDISIEIPGVISFVEENNIDINIKNKGDKLDKLSFSLSSEFEDIVTLTEEITNLEKDKTAYLNLSTNPILTRTKPGLLIQGFATKLIERQTKNITGNLIVKGIFEDEVKIDKSIPVIMEVILFDKIKLERTSPLFVIILLGLLIAITIVYLTTRFKFKFNVK